MKSAYQKNRELQDQLLKLTPGVTFEDCAVLRRAASILTRWTELECGDSDDYASWAIERDETTEVPYYIVRPYNSNNVQKRRIPDREKGALKRVAAICARLGLHFYNQTDPRGLPLYVDKEPLPDNNYNCGIGIGE